MTRILICDDEGIVRESLQFMIRKFFGAECEIECARNGRTAIELTETFHPDIVVMDIQMPGINGIEAMREIRRENKNIIFIVLTAYDRFEYTQKSIDIGVFSFLTKPINRDVLCDTLNKAIRQVQERRERSHKELQVKEKLEAVIPIIENGLVYSVILETTSKEENDRYRELLNVTEEYGYVMVLECGEKLHKGVFTNTLGAGIKLQKHYLVFRDTIKETIGGFVGALMANKVIVLIPCNTQEESYEVRIAKIDRIRVLLRKLEQQTELSFKAGIGTVKAWENMVNSYREALESVHQTVGKVIHTKDMISGRRYSENYPTELEQSLFHAIEHGEEERVLYLCDKYLEWMQSYEPVMKNFVRLKAMEFVLFAEHFAYEAGIIPHHPFEYREGYLESLLSLHSYQELKSWLVKQLRECVSWIAKKQEIKNDSVVEQAKQYITDHFSKELTLDETAKAIGISPYYLSKLFKETEGIGYIEYVTKLRIDFAKEQLVLTDKSIKEVCHETGYQDPNYFSRIFKKSTGMTPTEYREGGGTV